MSQDALSSPVPLVTVKICPNCSHTAPADARICALCLQNIRDVAVTSGAAAEQKITFDGVMARERSRLELRKRWRILVMAALAIVIGILVVNDADPHPITGSSTRSMEAVAATTWSGSSGGPIGARITSAPAALEASVAWARPFASSVVAVAADAERVYVALEDGDLAVLDAATGDQIWSRHVPGRLEQAPTVAGGRLYLSQRNSRVVTVDAATGDVIWTAESPDLGFLSFAPVVQEGIVWVAGQKALFALDAEDGRLLASDEFDHRASTAPAVMGDHVALATSTEFRIESISDLDRTYHYPISLIEHVVAVGQYAIALNDHLMVAAREDEHQHWWEGVRTRLLWTDYHVRGVLPEPPLPRREWLVELPAAPFAPAADRTRLYVADADGAVRAYRGADGSLVWEQISLGATAAPVLTADGLLVPAGDALALLDVETGDEVGRLPLPAAAADLIVTTGGTYVTSAGGEVLALR